MTLYLKLEAQRQQQHHQPTTTEEEEEEAPSRKVGREERIVLLQEGGRWGWACGKGGEGSLSWRRRTCRCRRGRVVVQDAAANVEVEAGQIHRKAVFDLTNTVIRAQLRRRAQPRLPWRRQRKGQALVVPTGRQADGWPGAWTDGLAVGRQQAWWAAASSCPPPRFFPSWSSSLAVPAALACPQVVGCRLVTPSCPRWCAGWRQETGAQGRYRRPRRWRQGTPSTETGGSRTRRTSSSGATTRRSRRA